MKHFLLFFFRFKSLKPVLRLFIVFYTFLICVQASKLEFCLRGHPLQIFNTPVHLLQPPPSELAALGIKSTRRNRGDMRILECPSGLLFTRPFLLEAVSSDSAPFCYKKSICDENWQCNNRKNSVEAEIIKFGNPDHNATWTLTENDDDIQKNVQSNQCKSKHQSRKKRDTATIAGLVPSEPTSSDQIQREVNDQTKRMFYYLAGINQDQVNSHLRVVKLFKMSSQLVSMICDPNFVSPKFLQEIQRAFLYLLKEQGFDKMADLDLETYNQLKQTLEHCATTVKMVKFVGQPCPATGIEVNGVYQIEEDRVKGISYQRGPRTFKWGEYDIVLDAAWSTMMVVHAGCFNSFSGKVNLLHQFEVALEQLFHSALYLRWEHPTQLADDLFYDSMFMAKVNDTLEAIDACTRFVYLLTPFHTPLNRPIHETIYRRKKRSVDDSDDPLKNTFSSIENFVEVSVESKKQEDSSFVQESHSSSHHHHHHPSKIFQCLQSEEEMQSKVEEAKKKHYKNCKKQITK